MKLYMLKGNERMDPIHKLNASGWHIVNMQQQQTIGGKILRIPVVSQQFLY